VPDYRSFMMVDCNLQRLDLLVERSRYAAKKNLKSGYTPIVVQFRAPTKKEDTMNKTETNRFNKLALLI